MSSYSFASIAAMIVIFVGAVSLLGGSALRGYQLAQVASENQEADQVEDSDGGDDNGLNQEEVQNILTYIGDNIKDYGTLLKRLNKVKLPGIEPYRAVVSDMLAQIKEAREILTSPTADNEAKQEALHNYNNNIDWPEIEGAGTAADLAEGLPKAMKFTSSISKLMNTFSQSPQLAGLIGLDTAQLQTTVGNTVGVVNQLNALINSGNLSEAIDYVRQEGEGGPGNNVETLYYQIKDLVSAGQRLNRLKKFPEVAEQIRGLLAPMWADFYSDPGGLGSLHQQDENGKGITDDMWGILDQAEERARQRGRKAASFNRYGYLAQVVESLNTASAPSPLLSTSPTQQLSSPLSPVLISPSLTQQLSPPLSPLSVPPSPLPNVPEDSNGGGDYNDDDRDRDFVNPQEIEDVKRQIKRDLQREIKQLVKQATKAGMQTEAAQLNEIMNALSNTLAVLSNPAARNDDLREAINNFHDARHWDTMNEIRAKVELPKQIKDVEKQIRSIAKLISSKSTKKAISLFGLDMAGVNSTLAETTQLLQEVKNSLQAGDSAGAQEGMRDVWDNNPGMAEGIIHQFRGFADMMRGIKNADLIAQLKALAQPGIDAFRAGDYEEAQALLGDARDDMQNLLNSVRRSYGRNNF